MRGDENVAKSIKTKTVTALTCILMVFSILIPTLSVSAAEESEIQPMAAVIDSYTYGISISGIKATCSATLQSSYAANLRITMELQKETSSGYENVETWTSSKYGSFLSVSESKTINVFSDYRLKVTVTANTETKVSYDYP